MSDAKRVWNETWTLYDHATHVTETNEWLHIIKRADCPHETELHAKCDVVMFEKSMADGRCDDGGAYLERAKLAAAAPDLYRALAAVEWSGVDRGYWGDGAKPICPVCEAGAAEEYRSVIEGEPTIMAGGQHKPDCALNAALRKARGET